MTEGNVEMRPFTATQTPQKVEGPVLDRVDGRADLQGLRGFRGYRFFDGPLDKRTRREIREAAKKA